MENDFVQSWIYASRQTKEDPNYLVADSSLQVVYTVASQKLHIRGINWQDEVRAETEGKATLRYIHGWTIMMCERINSLVACTMKPSVTYGHLAQSVGERKTMSAGHWLLSLHQASLGEIGASGEPQPWLCLTLWRTASTFRLGFTAQNRYVIG